MPAARLAPDTFVRAGQYSDASVPSTWHGATTSTQGLDIRVHALFSEVMQKRLANIANCGVLMHVVEHEWAQRPHLQCALICLVAPVGVPEEGQVLGADAHIRAGGRGGHILVVFFFKQKTAYEV